MTDINKYKSLAVDHTCYGNIGKLAKVLAPGVKISRAQVIKILVEDKMKKLKGSIIKGKIARWITNDWNYNSYWNSFNNILSNN